MSDMNHLTNRSADSEKKYPAASKVIIGPEPMPDRADFLEDMIQKTEAALADAPAGTLVIRHPKHTKRAPEYFQRIPGNPVLEIYIPRTNTDLIRKLAQKEYNKKVLTVMKKQLNGIKKYNKTFLPGSLDDVFNKLKPERQTLVTPVEPTTEQYIRLWQSVPYEKSRFPLDSNHPNYTELGELVRSKSEVLIANALHRAGLPYKYECPLTLNNQTIRPDFTILDIRTRREVYFEHFGKMDDPEYIKGFLWKINFYEAAGIFPGDQLLCTFESSVSSLDTRNLDALLRHRFA